MNPIHDHRRKSKFQIPGYQIQDQIIGRIMTFTIVRKAPHTFKSYAPYAVGIIELPVSPETATSKLTPQIARITGQIIIPANSLDLKIGAEV